VEFGTSSIFDTKCAFQQLGGNAVLPSKTPKSVGGISEILFVPLMQAFDAKVGQRFQTAIHGTKEANMVDEDVQVRRHIVLVVALQELGSKVLGLLSPEFLRYHVIRAGKGQHLYHLGPEGAQIIVFEESEVLCATKSRLLHTLSSF